VDATQPEQPASPVGPAIILVGAAGFVVACFLPYYEFAGVPRDEATISLYRLNVSGGPSGGGFASQVGGFLSLFAGVAIIASIAILLLRRRPGSWTLPALAAAVTVWSLSWFGTFLRTTALVSSREIAYWGVLLTVGLVTVGTLVSVFAFRRRAAARDEFDE
jgi:hypothetical protein